MKKHETEPAIDVLARTIWGEARGEGIEGMKAVACVVMNRLKTAEARGGFWWGDDIIAICRKPWQFSVWNEDDPNLPLIQSVTAANDKDFAAALRIARRAVHGCLADITRGATHYHAKHISPYWAKDRTPVAVIGNHVFYQLV